MAKKHKKGGDGDGVVDYSRAPTTGELVGATGNSATGAAAPTSTGSNGKAKHKRKRKDNVSVETVDEGLDELDESGIEAAQVAAALAQPVRDVIDPALQDDPPATSVQYQPPKKKQKKQAIAIEPSLEAPDAGPSSSDNEAALRLQEMLNFAMQEGGDQADGDATAAANALASAASVPNFSSATQEQLLAALRNINPDLVIHDPRASSASPVRPRHAAATNSAPATTARDLPQFTGERDLPVTQRAPSAGDAVIDPTLVSGAGAKSALNPTLMNSLAGMTHRDVLSQKWLNTTQLNELSDSQGLDFKKGQFSTTEKAIVETAIDAYSKKYSLDIEEVRSIIYAKGKKSRSQHPEFFPSIASSLDARPLIAVYNYVRRAYDPLGKKGAWTPEEDQKLADAVNEHGMNWGAVSAAVDRTKSDCRDRWRNHVSVRDTKNTGKWSAEEEAALRQAVKSVTTDKGRSADQDVFWSAVSKALGGTRSRAQCRIKWLDSMNPKEKNEGDVVSWTHRDSLILVQRLLALGMTDDTGFDWKQLEDDTWGRLFSTHIMQVRWRRLKKKYSKAVEDATLPELLERIIGQLEQKSEEQLNQPTRATTKQGTAFDATPGPSGQGLPV